MVRIIFNFLDDLDMPEIDEPIITENYPMDAEGRRDRIIISLIYGNSFLLPLGLYCIFQRHNITVIRV